MKSSVHLAKIFIITIICCAGWVTNLRAQCVVSLGNDTTICADSVILDAGNPGASYLWSDGSTNQTLVVYARNTPTTYSVTVNNSCIVSDTIVLTVNRPPLLITSYSGSTNFCIGGSVSVFEDGADTYRWSTGETSSTIVLRDSGRYSVIGTDTVTGCVSFDTIGIFLYYPPTINLGNDTSICSGTITLDASGPGADNIRWSSDTTNTFPSLTVTTSGEYSVTATTVNGCSTVDSINVHIGPPVVNLGTDTSVCGGSITLDAGNAGSTYHWSNNTASQTQDATTSGTYSVTVTSAGGCSSTDSIHVTLNNFSYSFTLGFDTVTMGSSPVTLTGGSPAGGTYSGAGVSGGIFNADSAGLGSHTISYHVVDTVTGCSGTATATVFVQSIEGIANTAFGSIQLLPNPNDGHFELRITNSNYQDMDIELISITGTRVMMVAHENATGSYTHGFNIADLAKGVYYLRLISGSDITVKRILVQ